MGDILSPEALLAENNDRHLDDIPTVPTTDSTILAKPKAKRTGAKATIDGIFRRSELSSLAKTAESQTLEGQDDTPARLTRLPVPEIARAKRATLSSFIDEEPHMHAKGPEVIGARTATVDGSLAEGPSSRSPRSEPLKKRVRLDDDSDVEPDKPEEITHTQDGRLYVQFPRDDGGMETHRPAILPTGYKKVAGVKPWRCPLRTCDSKLATLKDLKIHFTWRHSKLLLNDNLDGTLSKVGERVEASTAGTRPSMVVSQHALGQPEAHAKQPSSGANNFRSNGNSGNSAAQDGSTCDVGNDSLVADNNPGDGNSNDKSLDDSDMDYLGPDDDSDDSGSDGSSRRPAPRNQVARPREPPARDNLPFPPGQNYDRIRIAPTTTYEFETFVFGPVDQPDCIRYCCSPRNVLVKLETNFGSGRAAPLAEANMRAWRIVPGVKCVVRNNGSTEVVLSVLF